MKKNAMKTEIYTGNVSQTELAYCRERLLKIGFSLPTISQLAELNKYSMEVHQAYVGQRTYAGRFTDHIVLLQTLLNGDHSEFITPSLVHLRNLLFTNQRRIFFFDVGCAIGNTDPKILKGFGKPAITTQEIARPFEDMVVIGLDIPEAFKHFWGTALNQEHFIADDFRNELLNTPNIYLMEGNGCFSLLSQWYMERTNPVSDKMRPHLSKSSPVIIRMCNSVDIYCPLIEVVQALTAMTDDFFENSVLLFLNKWILVKPKMRRKFIEVGHVSTMGFNHNTRELVRNGEPPFTFHPDFLALSYDPAKSMPAISDLLLFQ